MPQQLSSGATVTEPVPFNKRSPHNEILWAVTHEEPCSLQPEKSPHSNEGPGQPKINKQINKTREEIMQLNFFIEQRRKMKGSDLPEWTWRNAAWGPLGSSGSSCLSIERIQLESMLSPWLLVKSGKVKNALVLALVVTVPQHLQPHGKFFNSSCKVPQLVKNPLAMQETPVQFLVGKIPWRRDRLPTPVFLGFPCGSAGKVSTCNVGDLGSNPGLGRSPGEGNATHSSILAWRIPWTV